MRVQLSSEELWPYYDDWHGYGRPDFDVDVPDDLFNRYEKARGEFFTVLEELKEFLRDT
jgi:hypothetical protein